MTQSLLRQDTTDPFLPSPPRDPYFDSALDAWVLSRYQHVLAAFREPKLVRTGPRRKASLPDEGEMLRVREETLAALSRGVLERWRDESENCARELARRLPENRPVDLVQELALPWSLSFAILVTGANPADADRLGELAHDVSAATAEPYDTELARRAEAANKELEAFRWTSTVLGPATFVALSQTLPCFLANAWLTLLCEPESIGRLRNQPDIMPRAVEELLRCAGVARTVFRQAASEAEVAGVRFGRGDRAVLMLASANRDPEQFEEPERLKFDRQGAGQVALGAPPRSCAGGQLIRMAAAVAVRVFVERAEGAEICAPVRWRGGEGFRGPQSLAVRLHGDLDSLHKQRTR